MIGQYHHQTVIAEVDIDDEEESDDEEQSNDCISKLAFKDIMNVITVLKTTACFQTLQPI